MASSTLGLGSLVRYSNILSTSDSTSSISKLKDKANCSGEGIVFTRIGSNLNAFTIVSFINVSLRWVSCLINWSTALVILGLFLAFSLFSIRSRFSAMMYRGILQACDILPRVGIWVMLKVWGLGGAMSLKISPYFNGSYKEALLAVFSDERLALEREGFPHESRRANSLKSSASGNLAIDSSVEEHIDRVVRYIVRLFKQEPHRDTLPSLPELAQKANTYIHIIEENLDTIFTRLQQEE